MTILLVLVTLFHFSVAIHFCGGEIAGKKISLAGKLASCGMEGTEDSCPLPGDHFKTHCCDDRVNFYGIDNIYSPTYSILPDIFKIGFDISARPVISFSFDLRQSGVSYTDLSPPDNVLSSAVDLSEICVFRI